VESGLTDSENGRLASLELAVDSLSVRLNRLERRLTGAMLFGGFAGSMLMSAIQRWLG